MKKKTQKFHKSDKTLIFTFIALIIFYVISKIYFSSLNSVLNDDISSLGKYSLVDKNLEIRYPKSWILVQTPSGNHGDMEVVAVVNPIGDFLPGLIVARRLATENSKNNLIEAWGLNRLESKNPNFIGDLALFSTGSFSGSKRNYRYYVQNPLKPYTTACVDYYTYFDVDQYIFSFCVEYDDWNRYSPVFDASIGTLRPRSNN